MTWYPAPWGSDQGLMKLVTPHAAPGHRHDRRVEHDDRGDGEDGEVLEPHPAHVEHHRAGEDEAERRAEIGLDQDQEAEPAEEEERGEERRHLVHALGAPLDVVGEEEHHRELGELGRLEAERPHPDPAVGLVDRAQEEDADQEHGRGDEQRVDDGGAPQRPVVEAQRRHHAGEAEDAPRHLLEEEVVGAAVALLRERGGRAPHHDEAEAQEGHGHAEEDEVRAELLSHGEPPRVAGPRP